MRLTHVSRRKKIIVQASPYQHNDFKPEGFWYSVNGDWERWCKSEEPSWLNGHKIHVVRLGYERILRLKSVAAIDKFHFRYHGLGPEKWRQDYIDWFRVAERYDGIEIAPYQWDRRHNGAAHHWYYTWDCASGCIWRPQGVTVSLR